MDDFALEDVIEVAQDNGALIYLDEIHAVGLYGPNAAGVAEEKGVAEHIDIINEPLQKLLVLPVDISLLQILSSILQKFSKGFIFTTSMSCGSCR